MLRYVYEEKVFEKEEDFWALFPKAEFEFLVAVYDQRIFIRVDAFEELPDVFNRDPKGFHWCFHMPGGPQMQEPLRRVYMLWHKDFGYPVGSE